MNKKITIAIGTTIATIAPLATVVACGSEEKHEENEVGTFSLNSSKHLFTTRRSATTDVAAGVSEKVADAITSANNTGLSDQMRNLKGHSKIKMLINFADAKLEVDAQVKTAGNGKYIVTVNKVYTKKGADEKVDMTTETNRPNIAEFKKHVKTLLELLVEKSNDANATPESIKQTVKETYSIAAGLKEIHIAANETVGNSPFQGSWAQVAYPRNIFAFNKDTNSLNQLMNVKSPAFSLSDLDAKLTVIETAISTYARTLTSDSVFGPFAREEARLQGLTTAQSQITLATFMSIGASADDMAVVAINGITLEQAKILLTNSTHETAINTAIGNDADAKALYAKIVELLKI